MFWKNTRFFFSGRAIPGGAHPARTGGPQYSGMRDHGVSWLARGPPGERLREASRQGGQLLARFGGGGKIHWSGGSRLLASHAAGLHEGVETLVAGGGNGG